MSDSRGRILVRLAVTLALAVFAVVVLAVVVEQFETGPKPTKRAQPAQPPGLRGAEAKPPAGAAAGVAGGERVPADPTAALGFQLRPIDGTILLARRVQAIPPDVRPVIEILADGQLVLRRPEPLATGPGGSNASSIDGHGAAVVLPAGELRSLPAAARGSLIALLQRWVQNRPIAAGRLRSGDLEMSAEAVRRLLSWVP